MKIAVRVPAAERGELRPAVPEDGISLVAEVSPTGGTPEAPVAPADPLSEGSVERASATWSWARHPWSAGSPGWC